MLQHFQISFYPRKEKAGNIIVEKQKNVNYFFPQGFNYHPDISADFRVAPVPTTQETDVRRDAK